MPTLSASLWALKCWERPFLENILTGSRNWAKRKRGFTKQDSDRQFEKVSWLTEKEISGKSIEIINYETKTRNKITVIRTKGVR